MISVITRKATMLTVSATKTSAQSSISLRESPQLQWLKELLEQIDAPRDRLAPGPVLVRDLAQVRELRACGLQARLVVRTLLALKGP